MQQLSGSSTQLIILINTAETKPFTIWRETLKFGKIDDRPKIRQIFTIQFLHIYNKVTHECSEVISYINSIWSLSYIVYTIYDMVLST